MPPSHMMAHGQLTLPMSVRMRERCLVYFTGEFLRAHTQTLLYLYKMLVCPHLEYACSVWNPHLKRDIDKLEEFKVLP